MEIEDIANQVMFGRVTMSEIIKSEGLEYRKGKSITDVRKALEKAFKKGQQKTELEIGLFEIYFSQLFKKTRINK